MSKRKTTEEFIKEAKIIHGDKYDYSISKYINKRTKIKYICPKHGIIEQIPYNHTKGHGCYKCFNNGKNTKEIFIEKSNKIHNNKYDYSLVMYKNAHKKIKIICKEHGIFKQRPNDHLSGYGCIKCSGRYRKNDEFIVNSNIIHNNKYDYSLIKYKNNKTKVKIICPIHGVFKQRPDNHLHNGCPNCKESTNEKIIRLYLKENNIKYLTQKTFVDCKNIFKLPFDFYLPDYNTCIEYDGKQHYEPINYFGGLKTFKKIQHRDKIKDKYCKENNICLLRIKYDEDIISKISTIITPTVMTN
jgi:very-short-patch-repair endonuclease